MKRELRPEKKRILWLVIILATFSLFGCWNDENNFVANQLVPVLPGSSVGAPDQPQPQKKVYMDCLVNRFGIRQKLIVSRDGVKAYPSPAVIGGDPKDLEYFFPYYVFAKEEIEGATYYQIGRTPRIADLLGWVSERETQLWSTRDGVRYIRPKNGDTRGYPPLLVYATKADIEKRLQGQKVEPIARAVYTYDHQTMMPWIVIDRNTVSCGGKTQEILQIAFLGEMRSGSNLFSPGFDNGGSEIERTEYQEKVIAGVSKLDIVFVIDTTASMGPYIESTRIAVKKIAEGLIAKEKEKGFLAFGMVQYRDWVDGLYWKDENNQDRPYRVQPLTTNFSSFFQEINKISAAGVDSEDLQEAVFDGLKAALTKIQWRSEGLSERIIILIGDNSGHLKGEVKNPNGITVEELIGIANETGKKVKIFSLLVHNKGAEPELRRQAEQFTSLAQMTRGECYRLAEAGKVIPLIENIYQSGTREVATKVEVVEAVVRGDIDKDFIKAPPDVLSGIDPHKVTEVFEFLTQAGVDLGRLGPSGTYFSTGWVAPQSAGVTILDKEVYAAKDELGMLMTELQVLKDRLYSPDGVSDLYHGIVGVHIGERFFLPSFFGESSSLTMDIYLMVNGIPVAEDSILNKTKAEIDHMSQDERELLVRRLMAQCIPGLLNTYNEPGRFFEVGDLEFGWIPSRFLP